MNRKKFFTLFSTSLIGAALIKANPMKYFVLKKTSTKGNSIRVKLNPDAVQREKSGKMNG